MTMTPYHSRPPSTSYRSNHGSRPLNRASASERYNPPPIWLHFIQACGDALRVVTTCYCLLVATIGPRACRVAEL